MATLLRPPGPENRGIFGNFPMGSPDPLALYAEWGRRYGDIFYYRFLNRRIYFLNHPDLVRDVLLTNYRNFVKGEAVRFNRRIFGSGLVASEGALWSKQRRLIQPAFHRDRIAASAATMVAYTERMMATWRDGDVRDIHQDMMRLALEIVAQALFSVEIAPQGDCISAALTTLMELSTGARMMVPPALRRIPTPGNLRYQRAVRELDDVVYNLIRERVAARREPGHAAGDLLDTLLYAQEDRDAAMPTQQVRDEVMTLLLTGHETTAVSLSWTWYLVSQHPEVEQKLWTELRGVLAGRAPTTDDIALLPYADRVIKESMRLYPPVWAVVRNPVQDCTIGGYRVPAGTSVVMSQWVMHRDPRFYDEPERFNPDRWLEKHPQTLPKFAYFPFGGGPRSCIGASFATMEAMLVLATVAQKFQVRVSPGVSIQPVPAITLRPRNGVAAVLVRR